MAAQDLEGSVAQAEQRRDAAKAALEAAERGVEAATRELAGVWKTGQGPRARHVPVCLCPSSRVLGPRLTRP